MRENQSTAERLTMLDNALITVIIGLVKAGLVSRGLDPNLLLLQAFQPTDQGVPTANSAFIYKLFDKRYGFVEVIEKWDEEHQLEIHTELQQYETTFQMSALAGQDPNNPTQMTASDILNLIASILQSTDTVAALESTQPLAMGIMRITDVRNPYFGNDRGQQQASPSFDFTISHKQVIVTNDPTLETVEFQFFRV